MSGFNLIPGQGIEVRFLNYRDEWETRHLLFQGVDYGSNSYYPDAQWFLRAWDVERGEPRSFPLVRLDPQSLTIVKVRAALVLGAA